MKSHFHFKLLLASLFFIVLSGCKKASEEVLENIGKKITKETLETSAEAGTKALIKTLSKKEIENIVLDNGLNKAVSNKILKNLSYNETSIFINDLKKLKSNTTQINNNPDLIIAYKKLFTSESHRTNISYLFQTENWIKKGSKGNLVLEVPHNINKTLLGQELNEVKFIKKVIPCEGLNLSVIVPNFSRFKVYTSPPLNPVFYKSSDKIQFSICRANLRKEYLQNPKKIEKTLMVQNERFAANGGIFSDGKYITDPLEMLEKQKKDILQIHSGIQQERILGFVWHHNENIGIIDLVAYDKHNSVKHIGGRNIWGGGSLARR
ncbi:putative small secreted protein [Flavobacterium nitrogenifigens]|uniref:Small secreted protein n=2 Tax=Flavobacterium TaxID=237 RepID=A0ABR6QIY3_9FLAO|nr:MULTISPECIES: HNH endonuclease [Flavobacterium]MBB4804400.1 putative small secreted protein [Flavobacterium nitrogenifigens]MBB6389204.1 putative small secreted protein [Flavobacterium notoginsengisoli]